MHSCKSFAVVFRPPSRKKILILIAPKGSLPIKSQTKNTTAELQLNWNWILNRFSFDCPLIRYNILKILSYVIFSSNQRIFHTENQSGISHNRHKLFKKICMRAQSKIKIYIRYLSTPVRKLFVFYCKIFHRSRKKAKNSNNVFHFIWLKRFNVRREFAKHRQI